MNNGGRSRIGTAAVRAATDASKVIAPGRETPSTQGVVGVQGAGVVVPHV